MSLRPLRPWLWCGSLVASLALAGCGGGSSGGPGDTTTAAGGGKLTVRVTDAPFPSSFVQSATVTIRQVRVHDQAGGGWTTVFDGSRTIDLVPLTGGVSTLLVDADLPPGTYDQVRLIVDAGRVVLSDAAVVQDDHVFDTAGGDLKFPSASQSGLKLDVDNSIVVTTHLSADLVLDFDLSRSFVFNGPFDHAPGVKRVLFTPVIRAHNASTAGTLTLNVRSDAATPGTTADDFALAGATVRVTDAAGAEVAMALSDSAGHVSISLAPGTYGVTVEATGYRSATFTGVSIVLANATDLGDVTLAVASAEIRGLVTSDGATPSDAADDTVLAGALVEVRAAGGTTVLASATTDAQGAFAFDTLAPGRYDLAFSAAGFRSASLLNVSAAAPGQAVGQTVTMAALTQTVAGTVKTAGGTAAAGAQVRILNADGAVIAQTTTAADGSYSLAGIPSGTQTLGVTPSGGTTETTRSIAVLGTDPTSTLTVDVTLP